MRRLAAPALLALALLLPRPAAALAQIPPYAAPPHAAWRTLATPHFRVHYPAAAEAWARRIAPRLEAIWERVGREVGYRPSEVVDIVVSDPVADANGAALPFLGWPRMLLWTSPPGPESVIGHYSDWAELLVVHEATHLVHLLRPSRNPAGRLLEALLPLGPVARKSPRWATEGYATVIEGRLTGSGRPHGDLRAAVLRRWAQGGKLPGYGGLNDDPRWLGGSMAYLAGSAFLEWLEERAGPGSLPKVWARLSARRDRSFDDAFAGVFGDRPAELYGRFAAELTWRALEVERLRGPAAQGELWQDLSWSTGGPALAPDGTRLALVRRFKERPSELVVLETGPDEEAEKKWREERDEIARRDPEDVPAVRTRPLPREPVATLLAIDGAAATTPRWLPDGRALLLVRYLPGGDGLLHPDLFRWEPDSGRLERLTREADLRQPDPAPDGRWAAAVRQRNGFSQVVRVDLATGAVEALTEPSVEEVYDQPRVAPDGRRVAFARHAGGAWRLVVRDLATGEETELPPPAGATVAAPAWSRDGQSLYAVVGGGGFIDVFAFPAGGGEPRQVTRAPGAALAPEPAPDGRSLFYLSLEPDGLDLYRLDLGAEAQAAAPPPPPALPPGLAPAVRPPRPPVPEPFAAAEVPAGRPYGRGRQEAFALVSGSASPAGGVTEAGLRLGDVVGRLDALALGAVGGAGTEGGALAGAWRGWPVALSFHLFAAEDRPSRQSGERPGLGERLDRELQGIELRAEWQRRLGSAELRLAAGGLRTEVDPRFGADFEETLGFLEGRWAGVRGRGRWRLEHALAGTWQSGRTGEDSWDRLGGTALLGLGRDETALRLAWRRDWLDGTVRPTQLFELGGTRGSLLPRSALAQRIAVPALPAGTLAGEEYEGQRLELELDALPAPLFYERHRLWPLGASRPGDWLALAGLEWRLRTDPLPIVRLPALDLRAGVAQILETPLEDDPLEDDVRWWLLTVWRP